MKREEQRFRKAFVRAIGIALGLAALLLALAATGAGHGIYAPLLVSLPLPILYPLVLARAFGSGARSSEAAVAALAIAALLDCILIAVSSGEREHFLRMWRYEPAFLLAWFGLWAGWQVLALAAMLGRGRAGGPAGSA
jgi:hypothetical protein